MAAYNLGLAQLYQHKLEDCSKNFNKAIKMDAGKWSCSGHVRQADKNMHIAL